MSSSVFIPNYAGFYGTQLLPDSRGPMTLNHGVVLSVGRLPTDPIGSATVTFDGVNADSEIRVFRSDGVELAGVELCADDHVLSWPVYPAGQNSVCRIVIIHPLYEIKEFDFTPSVGAISLPVQQAADKWYKNPV
jgi:hypothetical protein